MITRLESIRRSNNLTQLELAIAAECCQPDISILESGALVGQQLSERYMRILQFCTEKFKFEGEPIDLLQSIEDRS